ncbi:tRNA pseudouridine synthase 4 [[Candida] railenensis]|uniref:tRNA pseudouridine(55) synthase n=1 Tax=[Candida] railenensis TaxID=45579 RepID=A0A9P0QM09_9ASCO|nr:tRNA pseudouridine synthase 4 [[Candida] railenensis]
MNGILAIEKPSGIASTKFLDKLQNVLTFSEVFENDLKAMKDLKKKQLMTDTKWSQQKIDTRVKNLKIKMGHGGTLDPLASGILIVGIGSGTKKLQHYLTGCNKTYETKALLGISTTTGDSEGEILTKNSVDHITKDQIEETVEKFVGDIKQTPPIFSALKMNGKPLYDYAREGKPLPRAIKARDVKVYDIKVFSEDSLSLEHGFEKLVSQLDDNGKPKEHQLANNPTLNDSPLFFSSQYLEKIGLSQEEVPKIDTHIFSSEDSADPLPPILPLLHLTADVSSGTYIRSLVSDFGRALGSSAYMVELIRVKQSNWELGKNVFKMEDFTERDPRIWGPILMKVFKDGDSVNLEEEFRNFTEKLGPLFEKEAEGKEETAEDDKKGQEEGEAVATAVPSKRSIEDVE